MSEHELTAREREVALLYADLHANASESYALEYLLPGFRRHLMQLGLDSATCLRDKSFLDAGCGGFAGGVAVADALGASPILGIDLSSANIAAARARFASRQHISFEVENLLSLSLESNRFDFVYCNGVLHHTEEPKQAFLELVRVLKPGGRLYIGVYGRGGLFNEVAVPTMKLAGKVVPRRFMNIILRATPWLLKPSMSLMDFMYVPIEMHYHPGEVERWFDGTGIQPTFLRHYYQPDTLVNRLLFGRGTMLFFYGVKPA